jgi:hypothetical protein
MKIRHKPFGCGDKFENLTILSEFQGVAGSDGRKRKQWLCLCICGKEFSIKDENLRHRPHASCGCKKNAFHAARLYKHGYAKTNIGSAWLSINQRCKPNTRDSKNYLDRGIKNLIPDIHEFAKWVKEQGGINGREVDRIDNNKSYSLDNIRLVLHVVNQRNTSKSKYWHIDGSTYESLNHAAEALGIRQRQVVLLCNGGTYNGKYIKAKDGCYSEFKYKKELS